MSDNWKWLSRTALDETRSVLRSLPQALRSKADSLAVFIEKRPRKALVAEGIEPDTLGLFEGASMQDDPGNEPTPTRIVLYLENIWDFTKPDKTLYRQEIRTTYLHELGHYLGLEEDDMETRELD